MSAKLDRLNEILGDRENELALAKARLYLGGQYEDRGFRPRSQESLEHDLFVADRAVENFWEDYGAEYRNITSQAELPEIPKLHLIKSSCAESLSILERLEAQFKAEGVSA